MKKIGLAIFVMSGVIATNVMASEHAVRTDRYTIMRTDPTLEQREPLAAIVTLSFGAEVHSLGDAINEVLIGSGYRWEQHNDDTALTKLPLPTVLHTMGPIGVRDALTTIVGSAWTLHVDELNRTLWFEALNKPVVTNDTL